MKKNIIVAQSGGPTAAINATLTGVIKRAMESEEIDIIYGARHGIQGLLEEKLVNISEKIESKNQLDQLRRTPAAALGSCRFKLRDLDEDDSQYKKIVEILHKYNIGYFIYIGGNDSMDTVAKLSRYCRENHVDDIKVIGGPKTIDNDLCGIDHCPGFGSAAKYIAAVFAELERESVVYETKNVIIVEMMGRHAGWLTSAAALAEGKNGDVPYLIYLEERPFSMDKFIEDVKERLKEHNSVMVAVSEGIHDEKGRFICETEAAKKSLDVFGHAQLSGTGKILEEAVSAKIGCKVRSIELNLLQRCASHFLSCTDILESELLGQNAVALALEGKTGLMSSLKRVEGEEYDVEYLGVDIDQVANFEKKVPDEWINEEGNGVNQALIDYMAPLLKGEMTAFMKDGVPSYFIF